MKSNKASESPLPALVSERIEQLADELAALGLRSTRDIAFQINYILTLHRKNVIPALCGIESAMNRFSKELKPSEELKLSLRAFEPLPQPSLPPKKSWKAKRYFNEKG